jgi:2-dehydro-3-deoxygluconokinase
MLTFVSQKTIAIGEAMIEMAVIGDNTYRRGFAGDTFNTAWHMSQIPGQTLPVGFLTKVGTDPTSAAFVAGLDQDRLDTTLIGRMTDRTMGLYMIDLDGAERSFQYWRDQSAAKCLAQDGPWLDTALNGAGLIHLSGITLAILPPEDRSRLCDAIAKARDAGAIVSFDPNIRPKLWSSETETRDAITQILALTDIALPSFDDEHALWGDGDPQDTITRLNSAGVAEIVVKNGAAPILACADSATIQVATPPVQDIRDTSGAGDAFNAGYLAARLIGQDPARAVAAGQQMSAEVIRHFGARIPKPQVPALFD